MLINKTTMFSMFELETYDRDIFKTNPVTIYIPKKLLRLLQRKVTKQQFDKISPNDKDRNIQKILTIVSNLASTFNDDKTKWKSLSSQILIRQAEFRFETVTDEFGNTTQKKIYEYKLILDLLKEINVIEVFEKDGIESYSIGYTNKRYRLTQEYLDAGITKYQLTCPILINNRNKEAFKIISEGKTNIITKHLMYTYRDVVLPTNKQILTEAKRLIKNNYVTNKGKILTMRLGNLDSNWNNIEERAFVEDDIKLYEALATNGYIIPEVGGYRSGGRVPDSFNLMPSWIRNLITMNNNKLVTIDFKCLHPNIAINLFKGNEKYLTHQKVAENASIELKTAKTEHLSFFNKPVDSMKASPLWEYYSINEPTMINNLVKDKINNYKQTSRKLFKKEVEIMTNVIFRLAQQDIKMLYIYDAIMVEEKHQELVTNIMNEEAIYAGVYTSVDGTILTNIQPRDKNKIDFQNMIKNFSNFTAKELIKYTNKGEDTSFIDNMPDDLEIDVLSNDNTKDNTTPVKEEIVAETPSEMPITYNDDEWTPIEGSNDGLFSDLIEKNEKEINNLSKYKIKEEKIETPIEIKQPTEEYSMFGDLLKPNEW